MKSNSSPALGTLLKWLNKQLFPAREEALSKLPNYKIIHEHDDGDLTISSGEKTFVVTTDGKVFEQIYLKKSDLPMTVKAFVVNDDNKTLILGNNNYNTWDLPGGHIKDTETVYEALKRELKEEVGLVPSSIEVVDFSGHIKAGKDYHPLLFCLVKVDSTNTVKLSKEHDIYKWVAEKDISSFDFGIMNDVIPLLPESIKKEDGGSGVGTVMVSTDPGVFTPTYNNDRPAKKRKLLKDWIEKAQVGLVPKKVPIHLPTGKVTQGIRWINPQEKISLQPSEYSTIKGSSFPQLQQSSAGNKLLEYAGKIPIAYRRGVYNLVSFLEEYTNLALTGKAYPNDKVNNLFEEAGKAVKIWEKSQQVVGDTWVGVPSQSPQGLLRLFNTAVTDPSRLNKVIFIDSVIHLMHERGSALPHLFVLAPTLFSSQQYHQGFKSRMVRMDLDNLTRNYLDELAGDDKLEKDFMEIRKGVRSGLIPRRVPVILPSGIEIWAIRWVKAENPQSYEKKFRKIELEEFPSLSQSEEGKKALFYAHNIPTKFRGGLYDLFSFLEGYTQLAQQGKNYPTYKLNDLYIAARNATKKLLGSSLVSTGELSRVFGSVEKEPTRLNKVILIDSLVHFQHDRGSILPHLFVFSAVLINPRDYSVFSGKLTSLDDLIQGYLDELSGDEEKIEKEFFEIRKSIRAGLVPRKVLVHTAEKVFPAFRWVRPEEGQKVSPAKIRIPPAWQDVRVAADKTSPLQVVGVDKKGRVQYLYSKEHSAKSAGRKFSRLKDFGKHLPNLLKKIEKDLFTKEEAQILYLIQKTGFRLGSDKETLADKKAYGTSTLEGSHITINGDKISFKFIGKKGVQAQKELIDPNLSKVLKERGQQISPNQRLFSVSANNVRDYLKEISGNKPFMVKDFRTWLGTSKALEEVKKLPPPTAEKELKKAKMLVAQAVAKELGNTPAIALSSYIAPEVFSQWEAQIDRGLKKEQEDLEKFLEDIEYDFGEEAWEQDPETYDDPDEEDDEDLILDENIILKALVSTPMKEGRFDPKGVEIGDSVWITISNPESPLHGRHVLITKRPDSLFSISGGGGLKRGDEVEARRHLVLTGTPKKTQRDEELLREVEEAEKNNEPIIVAKKELETEARQEIREAANQMLSALGVEKVNTKDLLSKKDELQNYVEDALGEEHKDQAKRITDTIMRQVVAANRQIGERTQRERQAIIAKVGKRLSSLTDDEVIAQVEAPARETLEVSLPSLGGVAVLTPPQQESVLANYFQDRVEDYFSETKPDKIEVKDSPSIMLGDNVKPLEIKSKQDLEKSISHVNNYWEKRKSAELQTEQLKKIPLSPSTPTTLAELKEMATKVDPTITPEELSSLADENYNKWIRDNTALAFYDAVGEHWNSNKSLVEAITSKNKKDSTLKFYIDSGAATAIAALGKQHLGENLDTLGLIQKSNLEVSAAMLALQIRQKIATTSEYDAIINKVRDFNSTNQAATEKEALTRHSTLKAQHTEIQKQKSTGELLDKVRISGLEVENLLEQRKNLGSALGSLQASATFYDYLVRMKTAKNDVVEINVGNTLADAESLVENLRLTKGFVVDNSDPENIKLKVGLTSLGKHIKKEKDLKAQHDKYEKIKTDMSGVSEEKESGFLVADKDDTPFWKEKYLDESGNEHEFKRRVEGRNDINWLLETTQKTPENPLGAGGGLITRSTGSGKTLTATAFFAHKLKNNPEYKGLIAVPKGRAKQWVEEVERYTTMPVQLIPEGIGRDEIENILLDSKLGTIYVGAHREVAKAHLVLAEIQANPKLKKFDGLVIDEPQELQARGQSGNIGELGKRIMKLPMTHRIALTATPARRNPLEAYDLIKWTSQTRDLGSKASFKRIYSGFGSGTNAQDTAIRKSYFQTIQPYISGDRITTPSFKVEQDKIFTPRTPYQIEKQKKIEAESQDYIEKRKNEIMEEARANPNHPIRRLVNWETTMPRRATEMARKEVENQLQENSDNGSYKVNAKLSALKTNLEKTLDKKHVIFIDSNVQRKALQEMFNDMGLKPNQVKNIASGAVSMSGVEMANRVRDFRQNKNVPIILIDKTSASGYNLQIGDELHVVGTPSDAAVFLQAQGRIARMPRKGDVSIRTYRYSDNPVESSKWNDLESQIKLLRATSPALFVGQNE